MLLFWPTKFIEDIIFVIGQTDKKKKEEKGKELFFLLYYL